MAKFADDSKKNLIIYKSNMRCTNQLICHSATWMKNLSVPDHRVAPSAQPSPKSHFHLSRLATKPLLELWGRVKTENQGDEVCKKNISKMSPHFSWEVTLQVNKKMNEFYICRTFDDLHYCYHEMSDAQQIPDSFILPFTRGVTSCCFYWQGRDVSNLQTGGGAASRRKGK